MSDASNTWRAGGAFSTGWQAGDVLATGTVFTVDSGGTLHLASIASGHVLGNTGTAAAEPADATLTALLDINFGAAEGNILYRGASAWAALPAGTSGQVLETQGTTAAPAWITLPTDTDLITAVDTNFAAPGGTLQFAAIPSGDLIANAGTGSIEPTATTLTALLDRVIGSTEGEIIIRNGSVWAALAPGTSGQALVTQGSTAAPVWMNEIWNAGSISAIDPSLSAIGGTLAVAGTYATQSYVNAQIGLSNNEMMAAAATTGALPANTYNNGSSGVGATLTANANGALAAQDGITLNVADLFLVMTEGTSAHNGLYIVTSLGSVSTPWILTRWTTFNQTSNINAPFLAIEVRGGTVNGNTQWVVASTVTTVGTDPITFSEWGLWQAPKVTTLGAGLTNTGGTLAALAASGGSGLFSAGIAALGATPTKAGLGLVNFLGTGAAATDTAAGVFVSGSNNGQGAYTTSVPATPYTITAFIGAGRNGSIPALGWTDGTKVQFIYCQAGAGNTIVQSNSNITTFSATNITGVQGQHSSGAFFRINDNGTNVTFSAAPDGINFYTIFSVAKASGFLGATGYSHIFVGSPSGVGTPQMTIFNWLQS